MTDIDIETKKRTLTPEQREAKNAAARVKRAKLVAEVAATMHMPKETTVKTKKPRAKPNGDQPRGAKTKEIARLLQRKNGCTAAEVLEATGWPSVSMPAMAKACGLKLKKEKEKGERTRYYGA